MTTNHGRSEESTDRELILTREFAAPRELVWNAWTDPAQVTRWWGPAGFTTTTRRMNVTPGGEWRYVMHGPDGRDYENMITFQEVVRPERLVYTHGGGKDCEPVNFHVTVTFETTGGSGDRTRATMRSVFPSKSARDFVIREYHADEGGKQHLARLAEYLGAMRREGDPAAGATDRPFVITRVFNATRDLVWRAWTERDRLARWFGPKGVTIPSCALDLRPGGTFHYCMRTPDGNEHWGRWIFREIAAPDRLVFVVSFADSRGNTARNPWDSNWPMETLSTVTFAEHAGIGGGTVVTVEWTPINAAEVERKAFHDGHGSMQQGWSGTMDQLGAYVAGTSG